MCLIFFQPHLPITIITFGYIKIECFNSERKHDEA